MNEDEDAAGARRRREIVGLVDKKEDEERINEWMNEDGEATRTRRRELVRKRRKMRKMVSDM